MSRLKDLRKYVDTELNKMEDFDKRTGAIAHLYGVSLAATMNKKIAEQNALDYMCPREYDFSFSPEQTKYAEEHLSSAMQIYVSSDR